MKKTKVGKFTSLGCVVAVCCILTACTSLQSQMNSYDSDIRSEMDDGHWNSAKRIIDTAEFECKPAEQDEVAAWRSREHVQMKSAFAKTLQPTVAKAKALYDKGAFAEGDKVRQSLKDRFYGDQGGAEPDGLLSLKLFGGSGAESGIPECLAPCVELAWVQMLSDRNLARMSVSFRGYLDQIKQIDVNGGKKSIKRFDAIAAGFKKTDKWKDKVNLFMNMLADNETRRWTPVDRSQYAVTIKKMSAIRDEVIVQYKTRRWNTRVADRKVDYKKIEDLTAAGDYQSAMQILSSHDLLFKPEGLKDVVDFDDPAERAHVASGALGEAIVRQVFESGLSGVQYHRRTSNRGMFSALVVGRTPVADKTNKRKLREAGRVAQMQARSEFVRFMNTAVAASAESNLTLEDEESHESFKAITKESAEAEVSNLVVLATGVDGDEVVVILGWRDPSAGTITPAPMHRVEGAGNFTISPSVGAYL